MLSVSDFLARFPEFSPAEASGLVQAKLDEASDGMNTDVYGDRYDEAQGYLAAHLLSIQPFGRNSRMADDQSNPVAYQTRFFQIRKEVAPRGFVT